jgi:hypothetical protein
MTNSKIVPFYDGKIWTTLTLTQDAHGVTSPGIVGHFHENDDGKINVGLRRDDLRDYWVANPFKNATIITGDNVCSYRKSALAASSAWKEATGEAPYKVVISDVENVLSYAILDEGYETLGYVNFKMEVVCF